MATLTPSNKLIASGLEEKKRDQIEKIIENDLTQYYMKKSVDSARVSGLTRQYSRY